MVDITEAVREGLLVAEPLQVLCKEECRGLCPVCGVDRNVESGECDTDTVGPRLAALTRFFKN